MKSIFYFTHIPWNWIKQRPQFLAEELSKEFDVVVFQEKVYNHKGLTSNKTSLKINSLFRLPLARISFIKRINSLLIRLQLKAKFKKFDYIWLTSPLQYQAIYPILGDKIVIYDCMDDLLAFPLHKQNRKISEMLKHNEERLIQRADIIFCSSLFLKSVLINRYNIELTEKLKVVNNAINIYEGDVEIPQHIRESFLNYPQNLCYIGTVSQWFDFSLIIGVLNKNENLVLFLFGPSEVPIPYHKQIIHFGPIEHKYVYSVLRNAGVLIMPFIINDLILSVNPVKLYEYIYCEKLSIARMYPEVLKFEEYVYLYNTAEDFNSLIKQYCNNKLTLKSSKDNYRNFGLSNTWKIRAKQIKSLIDVSNNNLK